MIAKKIRYKKKDVVFDCFTVYYKNEDFAYEGDNIDTVEADSVSAQVCPWCCKKYGLYEELETTQEQVEEEIAFYGNEDKEKLDFTCHIAGCYNGGACDIWLNWNECEIVETEI